jgi:hypothetical protein
LPEFPKNAGGREEWIPVHYLYLLLTVPPPDGRMIKQKIPNMEEKYVKGI